MFTALEMYLLLGGNLNPVRPDVNLQIVTDLGDHLAAHGGGHPIGFPPNQNLHGSNHAEIKLQFA